MIRTILRVPLSDVPEMAEPGWQHAMRSETDRRRGLVRLEEPTFPGRL